MSSDAVPGAPEPINLVSDDDEQQNPPQQQPIMSAAHPMDVDAVKVSGTAPDRAAGAQDMFFPPATVPPATVPPISTMLPQMTMCFGAVDRSSAATASALAMASATLASRTMLGASSSSPAPPPSQLQALPLGELEDAQLGPCNSDTLELDDRVVGQFGMGTVLQLTRKTSGQAVGEGFTLAPGTVRVEFDDGAKNVPGDTLRWLPKQVDEKHSRRAEENRRRQ